MRCLISILCRVRIKKLHSLRDVGDWRQSISVSDEANRATIHQFLSKGYCPQIQDESDLEEQAKWEALWRGSEGHHTNPNKKSHDVRDPWAYW
jgi:hypothetical protein